MRHHDDDDIPPSSFKRSRGVGGWIIALIVLAGAAGLLYWRVSQQPRVEPPAVVAEAPPPPPAVVDAGTPPPALPLADGDAVLRAWASRISSATELSTWLAGDDLLRRLVAAVNLIANGESPRRMLPFLEVQGPFEVTKKRKKLFVHPKSYQRYTAITGVIGTFDMKTAAQAYGELRPYLEVAYAEVAEDGRTFDGVLNAAINRLTGVTLPKKPVELKEKGALYIFADAKLEAISPAEKHLLRMGPRNARVIQSQLRAFQAAVRTAQEAEATAQHAAPPSEAPRE